MRGADAPAFHQIKQRLRKNERNMIAMLPITLVLFLFHISSSQSACSSSKFIQKLKSSTTNTSDYDQRIQQQIAISDVIGNKTDMKTSQEMLSANQSIIQSTSSLASVNDFNAPFQATSSSDPAGAKTLGQELSLNDLHSFRLEYNKYKILSHLGIGSNPDSIKPAMDDDLRSKLTTSTAMSDSANSLSSVSRIIFPLYPISIDDNHAQADNGW